jgi:hypothetical protein
MQRNSRSFTARLGAWPLSAVIGVSAAWIFAWVAWPWLYLWVSGKGWYWGLSLPEAIQSVVILFGPPIVLVVLWQRARRPPSGSDGAG